LILYDSIDWAVRNVLKDELCGIFRIIKYELKERRRLGRSLRIMKKFSFITLLIIKLFYSRTDKSFQK